MGGHVRVGAAAQCEVRPLEALKAVGGLFFDTVNSKRRADRNRLRTFLACGRNRDTVQAKSPGRLSRSTTDLPTLVKGSRVKGNSNTDARQGTSICTILAFIADLEIRSAPELQIEAVLIAQRNCAYERASKLTLDQTQTTYQRITHGVPEAKVASDLDLPREILYTALCS